MKNKNIVGIVGIIGIVILLVIAIMIPAKETKYEEDLLGINYEGEENEKEISNYETDNPVVAMYIEKYGSIVMELYPEKAPNTVNNFISLIKSGFYDNNSFHRLVPGFVLQGGDPEGNGSGGPGYGIKGEFSSNGFDNDLLHDQWTISMARSNDPDSAGSQFFICLASANSLDGSYAAFGKVIDGFDSLQKIEKTERVIDTESGKLQRNLVIKKTLVDVNNYDYKEPEIIK